MVEEMISLSTFCFSLFILFMGWGSWEMKVAKPKKAGFGLRHDE